MARRIKKKLTHQEEFEIMKLVMDKFMWLGVIIMGYGLFRMFHLDITGGVMLVVVGAVVLILLMLLIVKEYEILA